VTTAAQRFDSTLIGTIVVAAGVLVNVWASLRHRALVRQMHQGVAEISSTGPVAIGVATGLGGLVLVGVLLGAVLR
jgi:uncharacterized membrane protein YidH (DUF202 family)